MRKINIISHLLIGCLAWPTVAIDAAISMADLADRIAEPTRYIDDIGPLMLMGNSSPDEAEIVFLPEIHDDPKSLLTQLMLIGQEKKKGGRFIVLDESLESMKKSSWDIFSQKSLEIVAAIDQRKKRETYAPQRFELALKKLATNLKKVPGKLRFLQENGLWTVSDFAPKATPFFGWDLKGKASLTDRNIKMVDSLKGALAAEGRVLVMLGARHLPELEYLTSKKLICGSERFSDIKQYFATVRRRFGDQPRAGFGVGATLPIYDFLADRRYAVVFGKDLLEELDGVMRRFKQNRPCVNL